MDLGMTGALISGVVGLVAIAALVALIVTIVKKKGNKVGK